MVSELGEGAKTLIELNAGYDLKDSGERVELPNGVIRERLFGKGRFDLISPLVEQALARLYEKGAKKYAARNWERGMPLSWFADSAKRHLSQLLAGERDEDHGLQALWNLVGLVHTQIAIGRGLLPPELDDLPDFTHPRDEDEMVGLRSRVRLGPGGDV